MQFSLYVCICLKGKQNIDAFILKAFLVLEIFTFLHLLFNYVVKNNFIRKLISISKFMTSLAEQQIHIYTYTHIVQCLKK